LFSISYSIQEVETWIEVQGMKQGNYCNLFVYKPSMNDCIMDDLNEKS
jgi:hypothetical protein